MLDVMRDTWRPKWFVTTSQAKPFSNRFCRKTSTGSRSRHSRRRLDWPCLLESPLSRDLASSGSKCRQAAEKFCNRLPRDSREQDACLIITPVLTLDFHVETHGLILPICTPSP